jgi:GcrA cell cycle regulator
MEPTDWAPEHSGALRDFLGLGLSCSEAAAAINARFKTAYSRSAALGRARRMGLAGLDRLRPPPHLTPLPPGGPHEVRAAEPRSSGFHWPKPVFGGAVKLRCVGINPRHLSLTELEHGDCRFPYGGDEDGEAITFCGRPRRPDSSYCAPHFHLSRGPGTLSERTACAVLLRMVETA